ncbi:MAG: hypothetical protein RR840_04795 [Clostridium sp.]
MQTLQQPINGPYFITIQSWAAYSAYFNVRYISQEQVVIFDTPYINLFEYLRIPIPDDAYNITVDVYIATFIGWWYHSCQLYSQTHPQDCYELYGTIFNPSCKKVPCQNISGNGQIEISVMDGARYPIKYATPSETLPWCCEEVDICKCERKCCRRCCNKHRR